MAYKEKRLSNHPKVLASIQHKISLIEKGSFTDSTIQTLLIDIRDFVSRSHNLVVELGDFIAHPERDRGLFHKELAFISMFFKLNISNIPVNQFITMGMPEEAYNIIFKTGVSKISDKEWSDKWNTNKKDINNLLKKAYVHDQKTKTYSLINYPFYDPVLHIVSIVMKLRTYSFTTIEDIVLDLDSALHGLLIDQEVDKRYKGSIKKHETVVGLSILCLLQSKGFAFFDGSTGYLEIVGYDQEQGFPVKKILDGKTLALDWRLQAGVATAESIFINSKIPVTFLDATWEDYSLENRGSSAVFLDRDQAGEPKLSKHLI